MVRDQAPLAPWADSRRQAEYNVVVLGLPKRWKFGEAFQWIQSRGCPIPATFNPDLPNRMNQMTLRLTFNEERQAIAALRLLKGCDLEMGTAPTRTVRLN